MSLPNLIIGYGTGRCGTKSLASFLNQQQDSNITHEQSGSWFPTAGNPAETIANIIGRNSKFVGDVGFAWIHYVTFLSKEYNAKFINIYRNDEDVIESFYKNTAHMPEGYMDTWFGWPHDSDKANKDAIVHSIKRYRRLEEIALLKNRDKIMTMHTEELNEIEFLEELLYWLGFDEPYNLNLQHLGASYGNGQMTA